MHNLISRKDGKQWSKLNEAELLFITTKVEGFAPPLITNSSVLYDNSGRDRKEETNFRFPVRHFSWRTQQGQQPWNRSRKEKIPQGAQVVSYVKKANEDDWVVMHPRGRKCTRWIWCRKRLFYRSVWKSKSSQRIKQQPNLRKRSCWLTSSYIQPKSWCVDPGNPCFKESSQNSN